MKWSGWANVLSIILIAMKIKKFKITKKCKKQLFSGNSAVLYYAAE